MITRLINTRRHDILAMEPMEKPQRATEPFLNNKIPCCSVQIVEYQVNMLLWCFKSQIIIFIYDLELLLFQNADDV
jgi:uncharacterized protein (DUF1499 family)